MFIVNATLNKDTVQTNKKENYIIQQSTNVKLDKTFSEIKEAKQKGEDIIIVGDFPHPGCEYRKVSNVPTGPEGYVFSCGGWTGSTNGSTSVVNASIWIRKNGQKYYLATYQLLK